MKKESKIRSPFVKNVMEDREKWKVSFVKLLNLLYMVYWKKL